MGVEIDSTLTVHTHLNDTGKKAEQKQNALAQTTPYLDFDQKGITECLFYSTISLLSVNVDVPWSYKQ